MPSIEVRPVVAEGRHFKGLTFDQDQHDTELRSNRNRLGKNLGNVVGVCIRRDVVVLRSPFEEHVAHTSAREITFITVFAQTLDDGDCLVL